MSPEQTPLTPAAQMQHIREVVLAVEAESPDDAYALLSTYYASRLDDLHKGLANLEARMIVREQPFTSQVPVFGPLIVWARTWWNWMSTKWYVLPLVQQQNEFNRATVQNLREILGTVESLSRSVRQSQLRLARLETTNSSPPPEQE